MTLICVSPILAILGNFGEHLCVANSRETCCLTSFTNLALLACVKRLPSIIKRCCLLVALRPNNLDRYLRNRSAQASVRTATLRQMLQIKLSHALRQVANHTISRTETSCKSNYLTYCHTGTEVANQTISHTAILRQKLQINLTYCHTETSCKSISRTAILRQELQIKLSHALRQKLQINLFHPGTVY